MQGGDALDRAQCGFLRQPVRALPVIQHRELDAAAMAPAGDQHLAAGGVADGVFQQAGEREAEPARVRPHRQVGLHGDLQPHPVAGGQPVHPAQGRQRLLLDIQQGGAERGGVWRCVFGFRPRFRGTAARPHPVAANRPEDAARRQHNAGGGNEQQGQQFDRKRQMHGDHPSEALRKRNLQLE